MDGMTINHIVSIDHGSCHISQAFETIAQLQGGSAIGVFWFLANSVDHILGFHRVIHWDDHLADAPHPAVMRNFLPQYEEYINYIKIYKAPPETQVVVLALFALGSLSNPHEGYFMGIGIRVEWLR